MAEDEAAEENLIAAIERVHKMPWPSVRRKALWRCLKITAHLLGLEVVRIDPPEKPDGGDIHQPPAKENEHG